MTDIFFIPLWDYYLFTLLVLAGWRLAREDLEYRTVSLGDMLLYFFITIFYGNFTTENIFLSIVIVSILSFLEWFFEKPFLAKTDIFLLFTSPFFVPMSALSIFFIVCGFLILLFRLLIRDQQIPFAPPFFLSLLSITFSFKLLSSIGNF